MSKVAYARSLANVDRSNPVNWASPLNRGLVAWWKSRPGIYGNPYEWRDTVGSNHGRLTNMSGASSGWGGFPMPGGFPSLRFDGSDDRVDVAPNSKLDIGNVSQSVCASFRTSFTGANQVVFAQDDGSGGKNLSIQIAVTTGALRCYVGANPFTTTAVADGLWHRVCLVRSGSTGLIYLDGVLLNTFTGSTVSGNWPSGQHVTIGIEGQTSFFFPFNGLIDSVKMYARALSAVEVMAEYIDGRLGCPDTLNRLGGSLSAAQQAAYAAYFRMLQQNIGATA